MARTKTKTVSLPKGIRLGADGIYYWQVKRKRDDGTLYRKAGTSQDAMDAIRKFNTALKAFDEDKEAFGAPSVGEWADYCLEHIYPVASSKRGKRYADTTIQGYRFYIESYIKPLIGDVLLSKLSPEHVDSLLSKLNGGASLKLNAKNLLSNLYEQAQRRGKIPHGFNPVRAVQIAKPKKVRHDNGNVLQDKRILTVKEEAALLSQTKDTWIHGAVLIALRMGLRIGEVVALQWRHVDMERRKLKVTEQIQRIKGKGLITSDPKSDAGFRIIPIPDSVLKWLKEESTKGKSGYLFKNTIGSVCDPRKLAKVFADVVCVAGLCSNVDEHGTPLPDPTFHDLRSTFCTRMAQDYGVQPNTLIRITGHADIKTLLEFYVLASDDDVKSAMKRVA